MANTSVKLKNIKIPLRTNFFFNSKHNIFPELNERKIKRV
jgi:hypothetical protein